jgi:hypothetical protein
MASLFSSREFALCRIRQYPTSGGKLSSWSRLLTNCAISALSNFQGALQCAKGPPGLQNARTATGLFSDPFLSDFRIKGTSETLPAGVRAAHAPSRPMSNAEPWTADIATAKTNTGVRARLSGRLEPNLPSPHRRRSLPARW